MLSSNKQVRVRFAPSPTGYLHVGGARTALYNWLFARKHNGIFILRIEDTDQVRSTDEATQAILDGMKWLGMNWDEGPFFQKERLNIYNEHVNKLLEQGLAYKCYCSPQELSEMRRLQEVNKQAPKYDGRCREKATDHRPQAADGQQFVVRFKAPQEGVTIVEDMIHGPVKFENSLLDDFVIVKSDGFPTYNFAAVIDDHLMGMTHIIRGDDHLSNTPRQVMIYKALQFDLPEFAHIPMILGKDKARLSKRHGATSVIDYKDMGYLPEAMVNYLSRLGWGYKDQEIFSLQELFEFFDIEKVSKTPAVFDMDKLNWLNGQYIRKMNAEDLLVSTRPFLEKAYTEFALLEKTLEGRTKINKILTALQERLKTINEVVELSEFFFKDEFPFVQEAVDKHLKEAGAKEILIGLKDALTNVDPFTKENIEIAFRDLAQTMGIKAGKVIHPARVALTGRSDSPPMFDTVEIIGKERSLDRIEKAIATL